MNTASIVFFFAIVLTNSIGFLHVDDEWKSGVRHAVGFVIQKNGTLVFENGLSINEFLEKVAVEDTIFEHGATVILKSVKLANEDMAELAGFHQLDELALVGCVVEEGGMKSLRNLKALTVLHLKSMEISSKDLNDVAKLGAIEMLNLTDSHVLAKDLLALKQMKSLRRLNLSGVFAKNEHSSLVEIQNALPEVELIIDY
jgi:hypothetical protein